MSAGKTGTDIQRKLHRAMGIGALAMTALAWFGTVFALIAGGEALLAGMKMLILFNIGIQISFLLVVAITGRLLAIGRMNEARIRRKWQRMNLAVAFTLVVLLPASVYLALWEKQTMSSMSFAAVQAAELVAGAAVMLLLWANLRDGLALARAHMGREGAE